MPVLLEVQDIIFTTRIELLEVPMANSACVVRERIDASFQGRGDWVLTKAGDVDWVKRMRYNQTLLARLGVEIQVSSRSDLLVRDLVHLRNQLQNGEIDVGVVVVPSDRMQTFLTDRTPSLREAVRIFEVEFKEAQTFPIVLIAVEHDSAGIALPKKTTNRGTGRKRRKPPAWFGFD